MRCGSSQRVQITAGKFKKRRPVGHGRVAAGMLPKCDISWTMDEGWGAREAGMRNLAV
jgi:hypothetical protein